jgi:hypothetical protein
MELMPNDENDPEGVNPGPEMTNSATNSAAPAWPGRDIALRQPSRDISESRPGPRSSGLERPFWVMSIRPRGEIPARLDPPDPAQPGKAQGAARPGRRRAERPSRGGDPDPAGMERQGPSRGAGGQEGLARRATLAQPRPGWRGGPPGHWCPSGTLAQPGGMIPAQPAKVTPAQPDYEAGSGLAQHMLAWALICRPSKLICRPGSITSRPALLSAGPSYYLLAFYYYAHTICHTIYILVIIKGYFGIPGVISPTETAIRNQKLCSGTLSGWGFGGDLHHHHHRRLSINHP